MPALTDEEAFTLALLHGCEFWNDNSTLILFYAAGENRIAEYQEFENWCNTDMRYEYIGGRTKEELAHRYCEFFKLGLTNSA